MSDEYPITDGLVEEIGYDANDSTESTSSTTYQTKLSLATGSLVSGNYIVNWYFEYACGSNNKKPEYRVRLDDTTDLMHINPEIRRDNYYPSCGFTKVDGMAGSHTIEIEYRKSTGNAYIRNARLRIWRTT